MIVAKELEELQNGTWQLDCPNMKLSKKADSSEDVYFGGGYIRRKEDGELSFKLYSERNVELSSFFGTRSVKSGELIPPEEYYELVVTDSTGREWESKNILASTGGFAGGKGSVTSGMLEEIKHSRKLNMRSGSKKSGLSIKFFEDFKIPANVPTTVERIVAGRSRRMTSSMNVAKFQSCGYDFEISRGDDMVDLRVLSNFRKLPEQLEVRVVEALEFVLGRLLDWAVLERFEEGLETFRIKKGRLSASKWRIGPPLSCRTTEPSGAVWNLYDKYLGHILSYDEVDKYHPLSVFVRRAIQGSTGSIETESLEIGVSVEGIVHTEFANVGVLSKDETKVLENARRIIEESKIADRFKRRIMGAINSWQEPSATDRLLCLIKSGVINRAEYEAWKKLRHPSSHGRLPNLRDFQEFVDLCHTATVLFYKLIFHAIGYEGKYTDYSTRDWPEKDYPMGADKGDFIN